MVIINRIAAYTNSNIKRIEKTVIAIIGYLSIKWNVNPTNWAPAIQPAADMTKITREETIHPDRSDFVFIDSCF